MSANNAKINLTDNFQFKFFKKKLSGLIQLPDNCFSDSEHQFVQDLLDEFKLNGQMMDLTVKQLNYLSQLYSEKVRGGW